MLLLQTSGTCMKGTGHMEKLVIDKGALINPATGIVATAKGRIAAGTPVYFSATVPIGHIVPFDNGITAAEFSQQSETDARNCRLDIES